MESSQEEREKPFEPNPETLVLQGWVEKQPLDSFHKYEDIERETGVAMDTEGKAYLETAFNRLGIERHCAPSAGVTIVGPLNAVHRATWRTTKVARAAGRALKTTKRMLGFGDRLHVRDKAILEESAASHCALLAQSRRAVRKAKQDAKAEALTPVVEVASPSLPKRRTHEDNHVGASAGV